MNYDEMLESLETAPNVKVRDRAVIARVLHEAGVENHADLASKIIAAQVEAGLATFILTDIRGYVEAVIEQATA